jgi:hypothetical protein
MAAGLSQARIVVDIYVGTMSTTLALWANGCVGLGALDDGAPGFGMVLAGYQ